MPAMPSIAAFTADEVEVLGTCPWCSSDRSSHLFDEQGWPYVQCEICTLIYLKVRVREEHVHRLYDAAGYHPVANSAAARHRGRGRLEVLGPLPKGTRVFEDGAGNGAFLAACREEGLNASGCDLGRDAIAAAAEHFDVALNHGTLADIQLPDASVDVLASFNLLSHLYRPWEYFREVRRVLVPGGRFLVRVGDRSGSMRDVRWGRWSAPEHVFHFTRPVLGEMMAPAGLGIDEVRPAFDSDYPYVLFDYSRKPKTLPQWVAAHASSLTSRAWTALGLPKDDVFVLASKRG